MSVGSDYLKSLKPYLFWRLGTNGGVDQSGQASGSNRDGVASGGASLGNAASLIASDTTDGATLFNGSTNYVIGGTGVAGTSPVNIPSVSLVMEFQWNGTIPASSKWLAGFCDGLGGGSADKFFEILNNGRINWECYDGGAKDVTTAAPLEPNVPHLLVGTADGTTSKFYVDGVLAGQIACGPTFTGYTVRNIFVSGNQATRGFYAYTADEFAIFERAITAIEVAALSKLYLEAPRRIDVRSEPARMAANFGTVIGTPLRAGWDERDVINQPKKYDFTTEMPGGFGPMNVVLPRPDDWDPMDGKLLNNAQLEDEAGRNVCEGEIVGMPHTGVNEIEVQTQGYSKTTEDDETASMIFRDTDMGHWGGASAAYKIAQAANWRMLDPGIVTDPVSGAPALEMRSDAAWPGAPHLHMTAMYDAGAACRIGAFYSAGKVVAVIGTADAAWHVQRNISEDDQTAVADQIDTSPTGVPGPAGTQTATTATKRYAIIKVYKGAADAAAGHSYFWTSLVVYGTHGLTTVGTDPAGGLLVSDMLSYIVKKWCPNIKGVDIEKTSFAVPQADFRDANTTARTMIDSLVIYGGDSIQPLDWFVYDGQIFSAKSPGTYGNTWRMRRDEGLTPNDQGPDAQERINGARIVYNPGDGSVKSVGPVGSGSDVETSSLQILDPDHPANAAGKRKWKGWDVGVNSQGGATLLGQLILFEKNRQEWRGDIELSGEQRDAANNYQPPYMVRAGDRGVVEDDRDTRERRIIGTSYDSKSRKTKCSIGAKPDRFDSFLARAGIVSGYGAPVAGGESRRGSGIRGSMQQVTWG